MITVKHDTQLPLAKGFSRIAKRWKNTTLSWSKLLNTLSTPIRTAETFAEYCSMSKSQRDSVKDVGGFVGGYLNKGQRAPQSVKFRQIVTLDADSTNENFIGLCDLFLGSYAYAIYSTKSHSPKSPKYRLIIPLAKAVKPDAYQAVARKIADMIGLEYFDKTTYQAERLMYWPSCSCDAEYVFEYNDAPFLRAKTILNMYEDWTDTSSWPTLQSVEGSIARDAKKQGNPLEKKGVIGAFCRTYTIGEAIERFLSDRYTACDVEDRYTYVEGTAAAGLVVYDDMFAYSHHATDPASCMLCNAFDLVRVHLFSELDADLDERTATTEKPSYQAMYDLAVNDETVKRLMIQERQESAKDDFTDDLDDDLNWADKLKLNKQGRPERTAENVITILAHDPTLKGKIAMDLFSNRIMILDKLPWSSKEDGQFWTDTDDSCLRNYLSKVYDLTGKQIIDDAMREVTRKRNGFHSVKDYLSDLEWDGVNRVESLWVEYLGAPDTNYTRTVTKAHLVAAIARIMTPGVKFDNMIVLAGAQGIGKSLMLKRLGRAWFTDTLLGVQGKEALEQLRDAWIIEMAEMWATKKAEDDAIKAFLSKQEDRYRAPYDRTLSYFPRQCVFYGTTNDMQFLRDRTGNRRFWPIECIKERATKVPYRDFTSYEVDQVWAEAYCLWDLGESIHLDPEITKAAERVQKKYTVESEKTGLIIEYLDKKLPADWSKMDMFERRNWLREGQEQSENPGTKVRKKVCALEVWCEVFGGDAKTLTGLQSRELNDILCSLEGWDRYNNGEKTRFGPLYGQQRGFGRIS